MELRVTQEMRVLSEQAKLDMMKRLDVTNARVANQDLAINEGKLPTLEGFQQLCKDRAQNIRDETTLKPNYLSPALFDEAKRLERAANGDMKELAREAKIHADFYDFLAETPTGEQANKPKHIAARDNWNRLAESVEATKKQQEPTIE